MPTGFRPVLSGAQVDASGLEIGDHAVLCEDFDAAVGPLRPGPAAGSEVFLG